MPNARIDKSKTINENYPGLNFNAAFDSNASLYDAESTSQVVLNEKFKTYIYIWEYGYYFASYFIAKSSIDNSEAPIAALFTDAHSSIRGSFLLNLKGYHAESIALLRKCHESLIRALAVKANPKNIWNIVQASDIRKTEHSVGLELNTLYNLESSFTHSNKLKLFKIGIDLQSGKKDIDVHYGPQINEQEFSYTSKVSLFWLYALIKSATKLFPGRANEYWMSKEEESSRLLFDYLQETKSALAKECDQINQALEKTFPSSK